MSVVVNPFTGSPFPTKRATGGATTRAPLGSMMECETLAGLVTVRVPLAPFQGAVFAVSDVDGDAVAHPITVAGAGQLIDGAASLQLDTNGIVAVFTYDDGQWRRLAVQRVLDPPFPGVPLYFDAEAAIGSAPVTSVGATAPITTTGGTAPVIGITAATNLARGSMSATDKAKLDGIQKQGATTALGGGLNIDWSLSGTYSKTLAAGANALTMTNAADGQSISARLKSDAGGSTVTWAPPAGMTLEWSGGVAPTQTPTGTDVYTFIVFGTVIEGSVVPDMR